ncbi:MAG: hypothetical protein V3U56_16300 [Syntrophobacteria bacterium]
MPAATAETTVLPGVLGCRTLRRTVQVRLGSNPLRLPGGTLFSTVSRHQLVKHPGYQPSRYVQLSALSSSDAY